MSLMKLWPFVRRGLISAARTVLIGVLSVPVHIVLIVLTVLSFALTVVGVGLVLAPLVQLLVRRYADLRRWMAREWGGVDIPSPYRPRPAGAWIGSPRRWLWLVRDPATWRDLLWLVGGAPLGFASGLATLVMFVYGAQGMLVIPVIADVASDDYSGYGVTWPLNPSSYITVPFQGALVTAAVLYAAPWVLWAIGRYDHSLLAPTSSAVLARRVDRLTETRTQVVDAQAAELRRIERDLHDGAQARIVALGMSLGMAEDLVVRDPAAAQLLIAEAREASGMALAELRQLVRGIHPPVLAERGLTGGLSALALTLPLPVAVAGDLPGRPAAPVESALYFAVAEALANVVKHSGATEAWVSLTYCHATQVSAVAAQPAGGGSGGAIYCTVGDDGIGGAAPRPGSGLAGVERRLAAFDGALRVDSPPGGPTVLTMELPCVLSSPKTTPSSATG
ncbi:sensor domain-containing protein [Dactylosporangium matsuzakiense]|uniref:histidine kinase n=2 Tax=Dactylosporangium matsuzakiense TaxID=53360 RepID=A0A9W6KDR4_9ACTN|nr:sensor domain-containing protein [Dactylosporangium matsuzakiense]GLK98385.1 histidine kinase [Dactylosporangium matsuzakiense]